MSETDDAQAELLRQFQAAISGMKLADLRGPSDDLTSFDWEASDRPELRRPRRDQVAIFRIRVDLDDAKPPIWRRLDLRSDLPLDVVHQVLQAAFDWTDSHLHRFSLGGHVFDATSQLFLCPYDAEEGEDFDGGIPATQVRLDETFQVPGDFMAYVYDYGDNWEVTLRLEEVLPAAPDASSAVAVDGQNAAPPDDSGGRTDRASIALVVDDPTQFDLEKLNQALRGPYFVLREAGVNQQLVDLVNRLSYTAVGQDLERLLALITHRTEPNSGAIAEALTAHRWFLDRAERGGIELTSAGYLKPADVEAACLVVPAMRAWWGKANREIHASPVLSFRESLQAMGLLRKYKGTLLLTRAGAASQRDPARIWAHLAMRIIPAKADEFETIATLLVLAYAATSPAANFPGEQVAVVLAELGWRHSDGQPLEAYDLYRLNVFTALVNISNEQTKHREGTWVSPEAAALCHTALLLAR